MASLLKQVARYPARLLVPRRYRQPIKRKLRELRHPIRVAIIGCGEIAPIHIGSFEATGEANVVAACDIRPAALARAQYWMIGGRTYRDPAQMLREQRVDAVSICTWANSHLELVKAAAAAGVKAILCEKPLALTMAEVDEMIAVCAAAGVKLAGGHQYRFHPNFLKAAEMVRASILGRITKVKAWVAGTLADNGPHLMDTLRFLLGDPAADSITARLERRENRFYQSLPAEDGARGEIAFRNGVTAEFFTGSMAPGFFAFHIEGESGELTVGPTEFATSCLVPAVNGHPEDYRLRQFREFVHWAKGQRSSYAANADAAAAAVELVLGAYESARAGASVELPLRERGEVIRRLYPEVAPDIQIDAVPRTNPRNGSARLAMDGGPRTATDWFELRPSVGHGEIKALKRVIRSGNMNYVDGQEVRGLTEEWAAFYASPLAVASSSGTAAIHVALGAINPEPGDEIITTPITDMGSVIPILACNCIPVFADVDPRTGNLTAETIAAKITPRTRAVILVHLFGRPADLSGITALCAAHNLTLIEDCCQAHAAEYHGRKVGTFGAFGCFSLQQSKQITCGDGGITLVNQPEYAERALLFADKGWSRQHGRRHLFLGMNYRMTELQAAVAREQLRKLPRLVARRREMAAMLCGLLSQIRGIIPPLVPPETFCSWWIYNFAIDENILGVSTDAFYDALCTEGASVSRRYLPGPVFGYEVLTEQNTYGRSGYPFTAAAGYEAPRIADYPGFMDFHNRQMTTMWSHNVRPGHVRQFAAAVRKIADYCREHQPKTVETAGHPVPAVTV